MSISAPVATANYPAVSNNRNAWELSQEIASFVGGSNKNEQVSHGFQALKRAVRAFDAWAWDFNILSQDITIPGTPDSGNNEYNLSALFHSPKRAVLVDSNGYTREPVDYVKWDEWQTFLSDQSTTSSVPQFYTIRNVHEVGRVTLDPPPAATVTWPTFRLFYHRQMVFPTAWTDKLQVPNDVEEAIFEMAVGHFISQNRNSREGAQYLKDFFSPLMSQVFNRWRSFEDIPELGA